MLWPKGQVYSSNRLLLSIDEALILQQLTKEKSVIGKESHASRLEVESSPETENHCGFNLYAFLFSLKRRLWWWTCRAPFLSWFMRFYSLVLCRCPESQISNEDQSKPTSQNRMESKMEEDSGWIALRLSLRFLSLISCMDSLVIRCRSSQTWTMREMRKESVAASMWMKIERVCLGMERKTNNKQTLLDLWVNQSFLSFTSIQ